MLITTAMPTLIDDGKDFLFTRADLSFLNRLIRVKEAKWYEIGIDLGFSTDMLDVIQLDATRIIKLLDAWLKRTGVQRNRRRGGPKLSHLAQAIGLFDTGFAEDLLENCKLMMVQEEEELKRENNRVDKASSPIQIPPIIPVPLNPQGNESVKQLQMLVIHTSFEKSMFNEALPSSLRYKPYTQLSSPKCIGKTLQGFPEIKTYNKPPKSTLYDTNQCHEQQFAAMKIECSDPDLSVFVLLSQQSYRADDEALVYQYMKQMGVSLWQKTLIVIIQQFQNNRRIEDTNRRKSRIINKINTTFKELRTPAESRRYPAFITIRNRAGDWRNELYEMMRETCRPSGREGFEIMLENT